MLMQVSFLTKLVALKPGKAVREMIKKVMVGKDEGADNDENDGLGSKGVAGRVRCIVLHSLSPSFFIM